MAYSTTAQVRIKCGLTTAEISDADLTTLGTFTDAEIDATTNQKFSSLNSVTEYYNIYLPKRADDILPNRIILKHYPVQSITTFTLIDSTDTAYSTLDTLSAVEISAGTYQSADYYCDPSTGLIELSSKAFDFVPKRAKITYTYGFSSTPTAINELSANLTAVRAWINFLGGQYNRLNSYSVPETSFNKGDFYDRGTKLIAELTKKSEEIFNQYIKKARSQIEITSGTYY